MTTTLQTALECHALGLPIVIVPPGCKGPTKTGWQHARYDEAQIRASFENIDANVGVILGKVIDIEGDTPGWEEDFADLFAGVAIPEMPSWRSRRGVHRLALGDSRLSALGKPVIKYKRVEIRLGGEKAAQSLLPPSTTDGITRAWLTPLSTQLHALPECVVERLLLSNLPVRKQKEAVKPLDLKNPGDDFCARATWAEILEPAGWTFAGESDGKQHWTRPGKDGGTSGTADYCVSENGRKLFFCFTDGAPPLKQGTAYSKFALYAELNHAGDFKAAADVLREKGFGKKQAPTGAARLIRLIADSTVFHTPAGDPYIALPVNGHVETYPVVSTAFRRWLEHQYFLQSRTAPASKAMAEAIGVIAARARFEGPERRVFTRVASDGDRLYLDLCNDLWQVVELSADGPTIINRPPVAFRRAGGMLALPYPELGGDIDELRKFVNVDDDSFTLYVAALVAAYRATGPYPILLFNSEHGSCKTTAARVFRQLIDPNVADVRGAPANVEALMLAGTNGHIISIDNASEIKPWLADAACRVSTGGGLGNRAFYTQTEEVLSDVQRPVIFTGIGDLTTRADFLDRCISIGCPEMKPEKRIAESRFWADFKIAQPRLLGTLLTIVCGAIRELPNVKIETLPRMADFALWATAAERAIGWDPKTKIGWATGTFERAYADNRKDANAIVLDDPLVRAVRSFAASQAKSWKGTASELLSRLSVAPHSDCDSRADHVWPRGANALSTRLKRLIPNLREDRVSVAHHRREFTICIAA